MEKLPFNRPSMTGRELEYLTEAVSSGKLSGDGPFTQRCHEWLEKTFDSPALLTHSCTGALEMAVMLADLQPGDEVILPSYTFVSTANAVVLRGAVPVFVDIRKDTLNLDETLIEDAITPRTKAIIAVHYAGVCAEMDVINDIASKHNLFVIEDAAQAMLSTYKGKLAGTLSDFSAFSFHETKNILSGEGGALIVNNRSYFERAEILREKGTNRKKFFRGATDKYTWVDIGSSYLPSELVAAYLFAQLETAQDVTQYRIEVCNRYRDSFSELSDEGLVGLPVCPENCVSNGHMFYLVLRTARDRDRFIEKMSAEGVMTPFHYVPLHSSPAGIRFGKTHGSLENTDVLSSRLVRLPVYYGVKEHQDRIIEAVRKFFA